VLINNIIADNNGGGIVCQHPGTAPLILYNNLWQNYPSAYLGCTPGEGNRSQAPDFVQAQQGDYRLAADSPLRDAGHPAMRDILTPPGTMPMAHAATSALRAARNRSFRRGRAGLWLLPMGCSKIVCRLKVYQV
jgi:hypothetical protein